MQKGLFITFEGVEGSGKTTQAKKLADFLKTATFIHPSKEILLTRCPGGTKKGEKIREIFLSNQYEPTAELLLMAADRAEIANTLIRPHLKKGEIVICDRFSDSTIAYQGYRAGVDLHTIKNVMNIAINGLKPDITFLLDIPPELTRRRIKHRPILSRLDQESFELQQKTRVGYLAIAKAEPKRVKILDAKEKPEILQSIIRKEIQDLYERLKI